MIGRAAAGRLDRWQPRPRAVRDTPWDTVRDRIDDLLEPVRRLVSRLIRFTRRVLTWLRILEPVRWLRWQTANDERTCPECGPLHGRRWPETQPAPAPPLHVNCRCRIEPGGVTWRVREVPAWRLQQGMRREWAWQRTGWA